MSLLTICQSAARTLGVAVPTAIIGNSEDTAVRLLALAKREVEVLGRTHPWQDTIAEHTFTTVATAAQTSGVPSDFRYIIPRSVWDRTDKSQLDGPKTAREWQELQVRDLATGSGVKRKYRIRGDSFLMHPVPDAGNTIAYEYVINTPVESSGGAAQTTWEADADVPKVPAELVELGIVWRFRKSFGQPYDDDWNEYQKAFEEIAQQDTDELGDSVAGFGDMPAYRTNSFDWRVG